MTVNFSDSVFDTETSAGSVNGLQAPVVARCPCPRSMGICLLALQQLLDVVDDAAWRGPSRPRRREGAAQAEGVDGAAVRGRKDLRADDRGLGHGAGAGDQRQQPRMVGRIERNLGDALEGLDADRAGERHVRRVGGADHPRVLDLQLGLGAQPVVVVVACRRQARRRPAASPLSASRRLVLGLLDAVALGDLRVAAREQRLGRVVERAQQRALPAGPDAGTHRADIAGGEDHQQRQALRRLHDLGEGLGRLGVLHVAGSGRPRSSAGDARPATPRSRSRPATRPSRGQNLRAMRRAGDRSDPRGGPWRCRGGTARRRAAAMSLRCGSSSWVSGSSFLQPAVLDLGHHADGADQVLVHRVVVVHVELHQRDDLAEIGHELAEHAALVHLPQDALDGLRRGQDLEEPRVGLGIVAHVVADQPQRAGDLLDRVGMEQQVLPAGDEEDADEVARDRCSKTSALGDVEPAGVDDEIALALDRACGPCGTAPAPRRSCRAACRALNSSEVQKMRVRSPTSLATRK